MSEEISWIAADWGTSNLRIWGVDASGKVVVQRSSQDGMGGLAPADFEPALLSLIGDILPSDCVTQVLICGMAGAKQGWVEAPYANVPYSFLVSSKGNCPIKARTKDKRINARILPGLSQQKPFDVMRGEETQISGFLSNEKDFDGILCMPGTHTKWVSISENTLQNFQTTMTGEMFALISKQSVLRHSLGENTSRDSSAWDQRIFNSTIEETRTSPNHAITRLFEIRAASLLSDQTSAQANSRLSGLLIGAEVNATKSLWQEKQVIIIGDPTLSALYECALLSFGCDTKTADYGDLSLAGLKAAHAKLNGEEL